MNFFLWGAPMRGTLCFICFVSIHAASYFVVQLAGHPVPTPWHSLQNHDYIFNHSLFNKILQHEYRHIRSFKSSQQPPEYSLIHLTSHRWSKRLSNDSRQWDSLLWETRRRKPGWIHPRIHSTTGLSQASQRQPVVWATGCGYQAQTAAAQNQQCSLKLARDNCPIIRVTAPKWIPAAASRRAVHCSHLHQKKAMDWWITSLHKGVQPALSLWEVLANLSVHYCLRLFSIMAKENHSER